MTDTIVNKHMKPIFIAEIKIKSPFGYQSPHSFIKLMETAIEYGDWISVHDNALWGGDYETISFVRKYTNKTILAKGLHSTEESIQRALDHGADKVLTLNTVEGNFFSPEIILREIEDSSPEQVWGMGSEDTNIVINSRNLKTGETIPNIFEKITDFKKAKFNVFQASNIKSMEDIHPEVSGFIVGTHLMEFVKNK